MPAAAHALVAPLNKRRARRLPPRLSRVKPAWYSGATARASPRSVARCCCLAMGRSSGPAYCLFSTPGPGWCRGTQHTRTQPLLARAAPPPLHTGHDDPRRYGAQTSNLWSTRVLGVRLLLRGGPACLPACLLALCCRCGCLRGVANDDKPTSKSLRQSGAWRPCVDGHSLQKDGPSLA